MQSLDVQVGIYHARYKHLPAGLTLPQLEELYDAAPKEVNLSNRSNRRSCMSATAI